MLLPKPILPLLLFLTLFSKAASGQENFYFKYDVSADRKSKIGHFSNGDLLVVGKRPSPIPEESVYFLNRLDQNGEVKWSQTLTYQVPQLGSTHLLITENDHIVFSTQNSITKLSEDGNVKWCRNYLVHTENNINHINALMEGPKNKIFIYGYFSSWISSSAELLIKIDQKGNPLMVQRFSLRNTYAKGTMTTDGNIVIARSITYPDSAFTITKLKPNGNVIWTKKLEPDLKYALDLVTNEGRIILALTDKGRSKLRLLKISDNGQNIIWQQNKVLADLSFVDLYNFRDMQKGPAGNLWINGFSGPSDVNPKTFPLLLKIEKNGQVGSLGYFTHEQIGFSGSLTHPQGSGSLFLTGKYVNDKGVSRHLLIKKALNRDTNFCRKAIAKRYNRKPPQLTLINTAFNMQDHSITNVDTPNVNRKVNNPISPDTLCYQCHNKPPSITGDSIICPNEPGTLATNQSYDTYLWSTGSADSAIQVQEAGSYWVETENNCGIARDTQYFSQYDKINVAAGFRPKKAKPQDSITFFDATTHVNQRAWYVGDDTITDATTFKKTFNSVDDYPVAMKIKDTNGCRYQYQDTLAINHFSLFMPNSFSPNDDGLNDRFAPIGYGIKNYRLSIFNRWGQQIYQGQNEGWPGTHKGQPIPPGQYIYNVDVTDANGDKHQKKGFVRVIR